MTLLRPGPILVLSTGLLALVRVVLASELGLAPDEAYYWTWSENLRPTFADHPPVVAWLIWLGTWLFGDTSLGVRSFFVFLGLLGIYLVFRIALISGLTRTEAMFAALLSALLPVCSAGGLLATPDTPLGFCWILGILALKLLGQLQKYSWFPCYMLAAALAIGFWSKFSALLLLPVAAVSLLSATPRPARRVAWHLGISFSFALAAILFYVWLDRASGASALSFQSEHLLGRLTSSVGPGDPLAALQRLLELFSGQLGLLTPVVALCFVWWIAKGDRGGGDRVLLAGIVVPLLAALGAAFFTHPEQNWAALGHPLVAILAIKGAKTRRRKSAWFLAMGLSVALVAAAIHLHALRPFLPFPPARDPVSRLHGFDGLNALVNDFSPPVAILCDNYGLASMLRWELRSPGSGIPATSREQLERATPIAVGSGDRPLLEPLPPGTWLILDETGDPGKERAPRWCAEMTARGKKCLSRADGVIVREIVVYTGKRCRR